MATLKITVHEARDLPIMDRTTGLADPYVVIKLDDMEHTTDIARRTRNPVWEHDVRFDLPDLLVLQEDPLEVRVYDHDIISRDDIVGMLLLDCNSIIYRANPEIAGWFPIIDSDAGLHGDIRLTIRVKFHAAENPLAPALPERYVLRLNPRLMEQQQLQQQSFTPSESNGGVTWSAAASPTYVGRSNNTHAQPSRQVSGTEKPSSSQVFASGHALSSSSLGSPYATAAAAEASIGAGPSASFGESPQASHFMDSTVVATAGAMNGANAHSSVPHPTTTALLSLFGEQDMEPLQTARVDHPTLAAEEEGIFVFSVWRLDPAVFRVESTRSMMEELIVKADPEHVRFTNLRSSRSINDARVIQLFKLSGKVRRQLTRKVVELQCNAVLGYVEEFDMEPNGIIVRAYGTPCVVSQVKYKSEREMHQLMLSNSRYLQSSLAAAAYRGDLTAAQSLTLTPFLPPGVYNNSLNLHSSNDVSGNANAQTNCSFPGAASAGSPFMPTTATGHLLVTSSSSLPSNTVMAAPFSTQGEANATTITTTAVRQQELLTPNLHFASGTSSQDHVLTSSMIAYANDTVNATLLSSGTGAVGGGGSSGLIAGTQRPPLITSTAVQSTATTPMSHAIGSDAAASGTLVDAEEGTLAAVAASLSVEAASVPGTSAATAAGPGTSSQTVAGVGNGSLDSAPSFVRSSAVGNSFDAAVMTASSTGTSLQPVNTFDISTTSQLGLAGGGMGMGGSSVRTAAPGAMQANPAQNPAAAVMIPRGDIAPAGGGAVVVPSRVSISMVTVKDLPAGALHHIGGYICARSVKIVSRVKSRQMISQERDAWWMELREELRANARAFHCNTVLGYEEETQYHEDVVLLSLYGTAVMLNASVDALRAGQTLLYRQQCQRVANKRNCALLHLYEGPRRKGGQPGHGYLAGDVSELLMHQKCSICHNKPVPEVLLAACTLPVELQCEAPPRLVQVAVSKPKPAVKGVDLAMAVSQALPFIEFALHKQLLFNLRLQQMNACFSLRVSIVVGPDAIIGTLTGSGCRLAGLPMPQLPRMTVMDPLIVNKESVVKLRDVIAARRRRKRNSSSSSSSSSTRSSSTSSSSSSSSTDISGRSSFRSSGRKSAHSTGVSSPPASAEGNGRHRHRTKCSTAPQRMRSGSRLTGSTEDLRTTAGLPQETQMVSPLSHAATPLSGSVPSAELALLPPPDVTHRRRTRAPERQPQHHGQIKSAPSRSASFSSPHNNVNRSSTPMPSPLAAPSTTIGKEVDAEDGGERGSGHVSSARQRHRRRSGVSQQQQHHRRRKHRHRHRKHRRHSSASSAASRSNASSRSSSGASSSSSSSSKSSSRPSSVDSSSRDGLGSASCSSSPSDSPSWVVTESSTSEEDVYASPDEWRTSGGRNRTRTNDYVVKIDDVEEADMMLGMVDSTTFEDGVLLTLPYVPDSANAFDWQERIVLDRRYARASASAASAAGSSALHSNVQVLDSDGNPLRVGGNGAWVRTDAQSGGNGSGLGDGTSPALENTTGGGGGLNSTGTIVGRTALTTRLLNEYCADAKRAFVHRACRMAMRTEQPLRLRVVNVRMEMMFVPNNADLQLRLEGCVMVASSGGARRLRALEDRAFRMCLQCTPESLNGFRMGLPHQQPQLQPAQSQASQNNGSSLTPMSRPTGTSLLHTVTSPAKTLSHPQSAAAAGVSTTEGSHTPSGAPLTARVSVSAMNVAISSSPAYLDARRLFVATTAPFSVPYVQDITVPLLRVWRGDESALAEEMAMPVRHTTTYAEYHDSRGVRASALSRHWQAFVRATGQSLKGLVDRATGGAGDRGDRRLQQQKQQQQRLNAVLVSGETNSPMAGAANAADPSVVEARDANYSHPAIRLPRDVAQLVQLLPVVLYTPLDYVSGRSIVRYLGRLSQHFIREDDDTDTKEDLNAFFQRAENEIMSMVQALVRLMGGNALLKHRIVYHEVCDSDGSGSAFLFATVTGDVVQVSDKEYWGRKSTEKSGKAEDGMGIDGAEHGSDGEGEGGNTYHRNHRRRHPSRHRRTHHHRVDENDKDSSSTSRSSSSGSAQSRSSSSSGSEENGSTGVQRQRRHHQRKARDASRTAPGRQQTDTQHILPTLCPHEHSRSRQRHLSALATLSRAAVVHKTSSRGNRIDSHTVSSSTMSGSNSRSRSSSNNDSATKL